MNPLKVFAPSLRATSSKPSAKRTVSESSDQTEEVNRTAKKVCGDPRSQRVPEPETVVPEAIVESGPVELEAAEEDEAAEVDDESCLSAAQLLSQHRGGDEEAYEDDYYEEDDYY